MTRDQWAEMTRPFADAIMADEIDKTVKLVAADFLDDFGSEMHAEDGRANFRALVNKDGADVDLMLMYLGRRRRCPLCLPPLDCWRKCLACHGRKHVRTPDQMRDYRHITAPVRSLAEKTQFVDWRIGMIYQHIDTGVKSFCLYDAANVEFATVRLLGEPCIFRDVVKASIWSPRLASFPYLTGMVLVTPAGHLAARFSFAHPVFCHDGWTQWAFSVEHSLPLGMIEEPDDAARAALAPHC